MSLNNREIGTVVLAVLAALVAIYGANVPSPPDWLTKWTAWLVTVVGLVLGPSVLMKLR